MYELLQEKDLPLGKCWQKDELERGRKFYGPPINRNEYKQLQIRVAEIEERKRAITQATGEIALQAAH